jgi:hypothetical protein
MSRIDWPKIWLVSWFVCFLEECCCLCCDGRRRCCWSELLSAAMNYRSGVMYFENDTSAVTSRVLLRCNSCFAWFAGRNCTDSCLQSTHYSGVHPHTIRSLEAACSAPRCGHNSDNCGIVKVEIKIILRPTVSWPVCLGVKPIWDRWPNFFFFLYLSLYSWWFVHAERSLWREDGSVVYSRCWASSAKSFSCPSTSGFMTIFYCLKFQIPPIWRTRLPYLSPPGTG